jgi:hypothetical protein
MSGRKLAGLVLAGVTALMLGACGFDQGAVVENAGRPPVGAAPAFVALDTCRGLSAEGRHTFCTAIATEGEYSVAMRVYLEGGAETRAGGLRRTRGRSQLRQPAPRCCSKPGRRQVMETGGNKRQLTAGPIQTA